MPDLDEPTPTADAPVPGAPVPGEPADAGDAELDALEHDLDAAEGLVASLAEDGAGGHPSDEASAPPTTSEG